MDLSAFLLQLPLMLILVAVALALAARLKSGRLKTDYRATHAKNKQLRDQTVTLESTVAALQLENKTVAGQSTTSEQRNRALEQQVKLLSDENADLRYKRDTAYERLAAVEADYERRYLVRQYQRWFQVVRDRRCRSRSEIGACIFYPMLRFLGYGEEAFDAEDPTQAVYAAYRVYEVVSNGPSRLLFTMRAVDPGIGITEALQREADAAAYLAGARKFVLADADTFELYCVGPDKNPKVRCRLKDLAVNWGQIYAELAAEVVPTAFPL